MQRILARPEILGLALLLFLTPAYLSATLVTVNASGGADYTTLSEAMRLCTDGDSILVYPGTYYGGESFYGKSLYVYSLAIATGDTSFVAQTILDGQLQSGIVRVRNCAQAYLGGFTIQHGTGYQVGYWAGTYGGGVLIENSDLTLEHCNIVNNIASSGAGISAVDAEVCLQGNTIKWNAASVFGGGISMGYREAGDSLTVLFSQTDLNSVYSNSAGMWGNDFCIEGYSSVTIPTVYLQKFTVSEQELARNRAYYVFENECPQASLIFNEAAVTPVAQDLYVSPSGSNANSGLSPDEPLKNISYALTKIQADSLNPTTIHIMDGTYSLSGTGELFPLHAKHYVSLIGEGMPTLDSENIAELIVSRNWLDIGLHPYGDLTIENLQLVGSPRGGVTPDDTKFAVEIQGLNNLHLQNLRFIATNPSYYCHLSYDNCNYVTLNDISIQGLGKDSGMGGGNSYDIDISNVKMTNLANGMFANFSANVTTSSTLTASNIVIDQVTQPNDWDEWYFIFGLVINGINSNNFANYQCKFVNCTIAHCQFPDTYKNKTIRIMNGSYAEFYNCIIGDNDPNTILCDWTYNPGYVRFSHCLIQNGTDDITVYGDLGSYDTDHILIGDPMFVDSPDSLDYLSANSPCIDAGTTDIPGYTFPATDLAGNPRIYGSTVDLGAYEYNPTATNDVTQPEPLRVNCYPNPIQLSKRSGNYCTLSFAVSKPGKVEATLYNIRGQLVKRLVDAHMTTGQCDLRWDGTNESGQTVGTGVYLYRVKAGDHEQEGRITVVK